MALLTVLAVATTAAATIVPAQPLVLFKRVAMQTSTDNSTMPTLPPWYTDLRIEARSQHVSQFREARRTGVHYLRKNMRAPDRVLLYL